MRQEYATRLAIIVGVIIVAVSAALAWLQTRGG
jgi:hypothetical protein